MPRQVKVLSFCEMHPEVESVGTINVSINGAKPKSADYCADCEPIFLHFCTFMDLGFYDEAPKGGRRKPAADVPAVVVEKVQADRDNTTCPLCGTKLVTRQGLSSHLRELHGTGIKKLLAEGITV